MLKRFFAMGMSVILSSCSIFGISDTPEAKYIETTNKDPYSVRIYQPYVEAQVTVENSDYKKATNKGFRELFKYITGSNNTDKQVSMTAPVKVSQESTKIVMTAPVLMQNNDNLWVISFVLPSDMNIDNAPKPSSDNIKLVQKPQSRVAVITFSGTMTKNNIEKNTSMLEEWMKNNNLTKIGQPTAAGYNPPWTLPFFRRNEIQITVS